MKVASFPPVVFALLFATSVCAGTVSSRYAGQEQREIKSLSSDEVQSLLAGKGMGLAKAAELNGHPGPFHVLQLASELELTESQRAATEALFKSMETKASALGASLVQAERELDALFASKQVTPELLAEELEAIGQLQAKVRGAHLEVHLAQVKILSAEQIAMYTRLRGYASDSKQPSHQHAH